MTVSTMRFHETILQQCLGLDKGLTARCPPPTAFMQFGAVGNWRIGSPHKTTLGMVNTGR